MPLKTRQSITDKTAAEEEKTPEYVSIAHEHSPVPRTQISTIAGISPARKELVTIRNEAVKDIARDVTEQSTRQGSSIANTALSDEDIDNAINKANTAHASLTRPDYAALRKEIRDTVFGYGPIEDLTKDNTITEIMVNAPDEVYVERKGVIELTNVRFDDDTHVKRVIDKIVSPLGRHIDESSPMVDARLPDGSRVNAVIPPIAIKGCSLTIRKFSKAPKTMDTLISYGTLNEKMAAFLEAAVKGRLNILISGGTGSGKTTLLNVLSNYIPEDERIITIEDAAELHLMQDHVVKLEARPANVEGKGEVTIRDLVRNSLRQRPDRIIVGEVRGAEALDMLQAMNTGHDGSLTTAHANNPKDAMARIETMALMSGMDMPVIAIRQQCVSAFDLIVQQQRFKDGSRKVVKITEVNGMTSDTIQLSDIFKYASAEESKTKTSAKMHHTGCGLRPQCCEKIEINGINVNNKWFEEVKDE